MIRPIPLLVGALLAGALTVAPVPPASAGWTTVSGDGWSVTITVEDTSWSDLFQMNFTTCKAFSFNVRASLAEGTGWSVAAQVRPVGGTTPIEVFDDLLGTSPGEFQMPGVRLCEHFQTPSTPTDGRYELAGVVSVPSSTPSSVGFSTEFLIRPIISTVDAPRHEIKDGVSLFTGTVSQLSHDGFRRSATGGQVLLDRLAESQWVRVGESPLSSSGGFAISAGEVLPTGSYIQVSYSGDLSVSSSKQGPLTVWPPATAYTPLPMPAPVVGTAPPAAPVALPVPTVKIKAVSGRSKLKVDVNPNRGSKYYVFQVQRKNPDGSWKAVRSYETRGAKETRTLNLRKGTYRVWVRPGYGFAEAMSPNEVTLKR
jgi:hypothetical protein